MREVVLDRDVRDPVVLVRGALRNRYNLRRAARTVILLTIDALSVGAALYLAPALWDKLGVTVLQTPATEGIVAAVIIIGCFFLFGLYGDRVTARGLPAVVKASAAALILIGLAMMLGAHAVTPKSAVLTWLMFVVLDVALRAAAHWGLRRVRTAVTRPALVIGRPDRCDRTAQLLTSSGEWGDLRIAGAVIDGPIEDPTEHADVRVVGSLDGLPEIIRREQITDLVIVDPEMVQGRMPELLELSRREHLTVHLAAPEMGFEGAAVCYVPGFGMPVFVVQPTVACGWHYIAKRAMDISLAGVALVLLAPLMLAITIAVRITSPGPVFYASERVGLGQRRFRCLKFRTMYRDADARQAELEALNEADGAIFKIRDDPRVTSVGRFLRKTSLDELPQLVNVIHGDMSLVGPRPLPVRDNELMEDWHKRRHVVLPGITGLWQINGRSNLTFDQMIELDFRYIENWSLRRDLGIIRRTIWVVLFGRGAY